MAGTPGYDSIMQTFGGGSGKDRTPALKPGDKLPDGRIFGAGMVSNYKEQLQLLESQKQRIELQMSQIKAKLAEVEAAIPQEVAEVEAKPKMKGSFTVTDKRKKGDVSTGDSE
jgi:hypothetical protein